MTQVEKIIFKHFKPKKGDVSPNAGWSCRTDFNDLKNEKIQKVKLSKKYQEVSKTQQMVLIEKSIEVINEEIDYFFGNGDTYLWSTGNQNLKKLIEM